MYLPGHVSRDVQIQPFWELRDAMRGLPGCAGIAAMTRQIRDYRPVDESRLCRCPRGPGCRCACLAQVRGGELSAWLYPGRLTGESCMLVVSPARQRYGAGPRRPGAALGRLPEGRASGRERFPAVLPADLAGNVRRGDVT